MGKATYLILLFLIPTSMAFIGGVDIGSGTDVSKEDAVNEIYDTIEETKIEAAEDSPAHLGQVIEARFDFVTRYSLSVLVIGISVGSTYPEFALLIKIGVILLLLLSLFVLLVISRMPNYFAAIGLKINPLRWL